MVRFSQRTSQLAQHATDVRPLPPVVAAALMFDIPGRLANTVAGTIHNAWRDWWIKRPGDTEWLLADDCRTADVT